MRHAESSENVKIKNLCRFMLKLKMLSLPSWFDIYCLLQLFPDIHGGDPHVTPTGRNQIVDIRMILKRKLFWSILARLHTVH